MSDESNYSKRSFPAVLVKSSESREDSTPGHFYYVVNSDGIKVGIKSCLPNAGDHGASWGVRMFKGYGEPKREWKWDGNVNEPTLTPSIHRNGHWHGWLTKGVFKSCK